ncbi:MAG: tetratricopeptide repeat protein [Patescibacteria group bacterium]|mgnify:CR=1 FL=1
MPAAPPHHGTPPAAIVRWFRWTLLLLAAGAVFWICTFKIMDRDFWWHITAGNIMLQTGRIIPTDPFAYTRAGLPYLATHEWMAQIILAMVFRASGAAGIILLRGIVASACLGLLLLLGRRFSVSNVLLGVWAVVITKGSFLERPQLFTFLLFALFLLLAFRFLDAPSRRTRLRICIAFIVAELLWVNMHGGAALLGCALVSFLLLQEGFRWWKERSDDHRRNVLLLGGTLALMALVLVSPPNGPGTFRYLWNLLNDQTIFYIAEWRPRDWPLYLAELWPFLLLAPVSLWMGKRHGIFTVLLLLATAWLSRQAFRHEVLFVLAALAATFYQLDKSETADRVRAWMARRKAGVTVATLAAVLLLGRVAYVRSMDFERQDNLFGFGQFDLARGAYDFLEAEGITGNMFNTYGIGGYLIYRGYPDRKVFIDGRNVDYGFDYLTRTYAAGVDAGRWEELTERYGVTFALVDYDAIREQDRLPYSTHLDRDRRWPLVYLDDWVAVYLKDTPVNRPLIERLRYKHLTATDLQFQSGFEHVPESDLPSLAAELERVRRNNPQGIKAALSLAKIALRAGSIADAKILAEEALRIRPFSPEPYAILGAAYVQEEQWEWAADAYGRLLREAGGRYPNVNYGFIAGVYEKAGLRWQAARLRRMAHDAPARQTGTGGTLEPGEPSLAVNPALDAQAYNEQGVGEAEKGEWAKAEEFFLTALKLNPGFAEAWNNLCALHLHRQRAADAIEACRRAIDAYGEFADAHFNLALAYYRNGSRKEAEMEALRAKELGRATESDQLLLLIRKMKL